MPGFQSNVIAERPPRARSRGAPIRRTALPLLLGVAAAIGGGAAAHAQQIRGRVIDEPSRSPLFEATVTLYAAADTARLERVGTAADGFFTLQAPGAGDYRIVVERIGYAPVERRVRLGAQRELVVPAFVLQSEAIALDPVRADARGGPDSATVTTGFRHASHLVAGARLATLERLGSSIDGAVRELGAGLRVRDLLVPGMTRAMTCVEVKRRLPSFRGGGGTSSSGCDMVAIVLDGATVPDPLVFFQHLSVREFESIEYVPGPEAGSLFGMEASANGALVLWTRGKGPHRSSRRTGGSEDPERF
jgi:hypothetical protein